MKKADELVGQNLKQLRENRRLSLSELAELTGVSKSALWQIEASASSPTIATLWKIANGLRVPFSAFLERQAPLAATAGFCDQDPLDAGVAGYRLYPLVPFDPERGFEIYYVEIDAGARLEAESQLGNTEEHVFLTKGRLQITVQGESYHLRAQEYLSLEADTEHGYVNTGKKTASAIMVISYRLKNVWINGKG